MALSQTKRSLCAQVREHIKAELVDHILVHGSLLILLSIDSWTKRVCKIVIFLYLWRVQVLLLLLLWHLNIHIAEENPTISICVLIFTLR